MRVSERQVEKKARSASARLGARASQPWSGPMDGPETGAGVDLAGVLGAGAGRGGLAFAS
jgi:hypothetical protein